MKNDTPDEELLQLVAQGDLDAFEQLVLRHQQRIWLTAFRLVADYQAAEDLAQEAFLRVFKAADRYRPTAAFRTYLYQIVVRLCLDYLRKGRPIPTNDLGGNVGISSTAPSPDQFAAQGEQVLAVQEALTHLPANQRTAIVLRYYEGLSGREIAASMDLSVKAVERLQARGRTHLERLLTRFLE